MWQQLFSIYFSPITQTIKHQHEKAAWNLIQTALNAPQGSESVRENLFWNGFALPDLVPIVYATTHHAQPNSYPTDPRILVQSDEQHAGANDQRAGRGIFEGAYY
jgi:hypothetical protein